MSRVHPCHHPLSAPQGCLDEIQSKVSRATEALGAPTSDAGPPLPLPLLRLVAALLEGGLVVACPPLYQGRAADSWFKHLHEDECFPEMFYLSSAASACSALGSEGRARLVPHVLAAAPVLLWGAAGEAPSVSWPAAVGARGGIDHHVSLPLGKAVPTSVSKVVCCPGEPLLTPAGPVVLCAGCSVAG
jgi:hypothetical protein